MSLAALGTDRRNAGSRPDPATAPAAISVRGLEKQYGNVTALDGLDLEVRPGSVFGFLGPNGAGKTTALSILAGLSYPTRGAAFIQGLDVVRDGAAVRQRIGFLRQDPRFYTWMTGREVLQFTGRFFALTAEQIERQADVLLDLVDLSGAAQRKMGAYSGGMRQRLGIAQALMGQPEVLLLDEPCSSLDPAGRLEVIQIMERLRGTMTVFYSTHILQDVERVADEVAIVARGRRIVQSPMRELLAGSETTLMVEFEGECRRLLAELQRQPYVRDAACAHTEGTALHRLRLQVTDLPAARRDVPARVIEQGVIFVGCHPAQRSLEDVFLELTGGDSGDIKR
jgi:ABC-2 type transport system ATP-binding protein